MLIHRLTNDNQQNPQIYLPPAGVTLLNGGSKMSGNDWYPISVGMECSLTGRLLRSQIRRAGQLARMDAEK